METAGSRGKSSFAKRLGLAPSTYSYYEAGRAPPAELLVKIAETADVDLRWLLTGERTQAPGVPAGHPIVRRVAAMLADRPDAAKPLAAFLDILAASLKFPGKPAAAPAPAESLPGASPRAPSDPPLGTWIPVLGRSAAGVPQFWAGDDEGEGLTTLDELIARHAGCDRRVSAARAAGDSTAEFGVQVISLSQPTAEVSQFVAAPGVRACHPDAFAVRIDGESMSPAIRDGDLVICSPSSPAVGGKAAVVKLRGQIGVTCKIYRREGDAVHLIAANAEVGPEAFRGERVEWAFRVLATVRA